MLYGTACWNGENSNITDCDRAVWMELDCDLSDTGVEVNFRFWGRTCLNISTPTGPFLG